MCIKLYLPCRVMVITLLYPKPQLYSFRAGGEMLWCEKCDVELELMCKASGFKGYTCPKCGVNISERDESWKRATMTQKKCSGSSY